MIEIQTYPFRMTESEVPSEKFPDLLQGAYSFSMQIEGVQYYTSVTYMQSTNSAILNIYDNNGNNIVLGMPIMDEVDAGMPNYLASFIFTGKYALSYQKQNARFVLWRNLQ